MFPKKYFFSVRTDRQAALFSTYLPAISKWLKFSTRIPLEGLAFLISAIIAGILLFLNFLRFCENKFFLNDIHFLISFNGYRILSVSTSFFYQ